MATGTETRTTTTTTTGGTSSTSARAHAREENLRMALEEYEDCVGKATRFMARELAMQLDQLGLDVVLYAIHQTATAPMPSWRYMAAILRRCAAEHVTGDQARVDDALIASGLPPRYQTPRKSTIVDILG